MEPHKLFRTVSSLVDLVAKLRGPGGCPWDAKQTDSTIKLYLLEEAYEVLDAVEKVSPSQVCQELGDLLFQILFMARMAEERNEFDIIDVIEKITEKMIRRHPHVFGEATAENAEDVADNWTRIKKDEKASSGDPTSLLNGVPINLPALLRAHRLTQRASNHNEQTTFSINAWEAVLDGFEALKSAVTHQDKDLFGREMGRCLFSLANLARTWGFNSEHLLRSANNEFLAEFEKADKESNLTTP